MGCGSQRCVQRTQARWVGLLQSWSSNDSPLAQPFRPRCKQCFEILLAKLDFDAGEVQEIRRGADQLWAAGHKLGHRIQRAVEQAVKEMRAAPDRPPHTIAVPGHDHTHLVRIVEIEEDVVVARNDVGCLILPQGPAPWP